MDLEEGVALKEMGIMGMVEDAVEE